MIFQNPGLLYALFALAIPIIIHLFNFRRTKRVFFSNTLFLKKVKEASSSKRRLKHYLILFSRLLFLFFLVMAFCQPFIPSEENLSAASRNIIYLDNSWSMSNEVDEGLSALDAATLYIEKLLQTYPENAEYKLITNDFSSFSNTFKSKTEISDYLTELQYSGSSRTSEEIHNRISNELGTDAQDIFWISDFQKSLYENDKLPFDSLVRVNLLPLYFNSYQNVHVDSIYLNSPFLIGNVRPTLTAVVSNTGPTEVSDLVVKVVLNRTEVATGSVSLQSNDKKEISFDLAFDLKGINEGRITFEEFPVSFDNDFYFTLRAGRKINVLEIKQGTAVTPVENVYGNTGLFDLRSFNISNLDYSEISKADLVVLNGLESLDLSLTVPLNDYIDNFGSILLIPAYRGEVATYRQLNGLSRLSLVDTTAKVDLSPPDFNDPFFQNVFAESNPGVAMPAVTNTLSWGTDRTAILATKAGVAYLSEIKRKGSVFVLGSPLQNEFSTFQNHAIFVPVMYRLAMLGARSYERLYEYIDAEAIRLATEVELGDQVVKLSAEDQELIPAYREVGDELILEVPKYLLSAGFYKVSVNSDTLASVAFNYAPVESDLRQLEDFGSMYSGNVDIFDASDLEGFTAQLEGKYIGIPLWKYAIVLALFFLLCEVLLIRFLP